MVRAKRCCVHAYFRINGVSKRWFKTPKNVRLRSWLEQNADSGGSMNAKSHITTFKWRHINAFPVHLSSNNSLEQCAVHAHQIVFFSREAWTVLPWRAFWIGVLNQRFKTLILPSQNKHERSPTDKKYQVIPSVSKKKLTLLNSLPNEIFWGNFYIYVWMAKGLIYHMTPINIKIIYASVSTDHFC